MRKNLHRTLLLFGLGLSVSHAAEPPVEAPRPTALVEADTAADSLPERTEKPASPVHALTRADVEAWADGYFPYGLRQAQVAGAVVVVVKDDWILFEKGYGFADVEVQRPVDPETTLFRIASLAKLFTATAVMQLVEQGRLDLDRDVNDYLDFEIPEKFGRAITLRHLLTHTAGFEEHGKYLFGDDPQDPMELELYLKTNLPDRIFPPGEIPAYSNYGAGLAGYIVERISGRPFEQYVEERIFEPLGITRASFRQPLPPELQASVARGYRRSSAGAEPFEVFTPAPAGALSITGSDLARFMIAHLNEGRYREARLLGPTGLAEMHDFESPAVPDTLRGMAIGFYRADYNGRKVLVHEGLLQFFFSSLWLVPDEKIGVFVSVNSAGRGNSALRREFFKGLMDRYYAAGEPPDEPTLPTAKDHGDRVAGYYEPSRRGESSFVGLVSVLSQDRVRSFGDGTISVSSERDAYGVPKRWREISPFVWREVGGTEMLAARVEDGTVRFIATQGSPIVSQPVPYWRSFPFLQLLLGLALPILLISAFWWPLAALVRRYHGQRLRLTGRSAMLYRVERAASTLALLVVVGWIVLVVQVLTDLRLAGKALDAWLRMLQFGSFLAVLGAFATLSSLPIVWGDGQRTWGARISSAWVAAACAAVAWFLFSQHLLSWRLNY